MPIVYVCSNCGHILEVFVNVGENMRGPNSLDDVVKRHGICPKCGKRLSAGGRVGIKFYALSDLKDPTKRRELKDVIKAIKAKKEEMERLKNVKEMIKKARSGD